MGAVAGRRADLVVLTSDNSRTEDPQAIIDQIRAGIDGPAAVVVEPDRSAAIGDAVARAGEGDVVMVLGKGHETTQTAAGGTLPFDDRVEVRRAVASRYGSPGPDRPAPGGRGR